jgi:hypothetical protein
MKYKSVKAFSIVPHKHGGVQSHNNCAGCIAYACADAVQFAMAILLTVDNQETMEETILVGDDLMRGPPSPVIPKEIASHVLVGIELCDGILRNLFLCE